MISRLSILASLCIFRAEASMFLGNSATRMQVPPDYKEQSAQHYERSEKSRTSPELQHADVYDEDFPADSHKKTPTEVRMEQKGKGQAQPPKSAGLHPQASVAIIFLGFMLALY